MSTQRAHHCPRKDTPVPRRLPDTVTIDRKMLDRLTKLAKRQLEDLDPDETALIVQARAIVRGYHEPRTPPRTRP